MEQKKPIDIDPEIDISLPFCFKANEISLEQIQGNWEQIKGRIDKIEINRKNKGRNSKPL